MDHIDSAGDIVAQAAANDHVIALAEELMLASIEVPGMNILEQFKISADKILEGSGIEYDPETVFTAAWMESCRRHSKQSTPSNPVDEAANNKKE